MALGVLSLSISNTFLLLPPAAPEPDRLVMIYSRSTGEAVGQVSYPDYKYYRENNHVFTDLAAAPNSISGEHQLRRHPRGEGDHAAGFRQLFRGVGNPAVSRALFRAWRRPDQGACRRDDLLLLEASGRGSQYRRQDGRGHNHFGRHAEGVHGVFLRTQRGPSDAAFARTDNKLRLVRATRQPAVVSDCPAETWSKPASGASGDGGSCRTARHSLSQGR